MKWIISLFTILVLMTSCSPCYYYAILNSNDPGIEKDEDRNFVIEDDTFRITYSFYGSDAPVMINIYNKVNHPMNVDWGRSYIEIGGEISPFGHANNQESIPALSSVEYSPMEFSNFLFKNISNSKYYEKKHRTNKGDWKKIRSKDFLEEQSPFVFRSVLTLYPDGERNDPFVYDYQFYVSGLEKAGNIAPRAYLSYQGDTFYVMQEPGKAAKVIKGVGRVTLAIVLIALEVVIESELGEF